MPDDNVIDVVSLGKANNLLCRMANRDMNVGLEGLLCMLELHCPQQIVVMPVCLLNHSFRLNHATEFGWTHNRQHVHR